MGEVREPNAAVGEDRLHRRGRGSVGGGGEGRHVLEDVRGAARGERRPPPAPAVVVQKALVQRRRLVERRGGGARQPRLLEAHAQAKGAVGFSCGGGDGGGHAKGCGGAPAAARSVPARVREEGGRQLMVSTSSCGTIAATFGGSNKTSNGSERRQREGTAVEERDEEDEGTDGCPRVHLHRHGHGAGEG